jgi:hypothetical protein
MRTNSVDLLLDERARLVAKNATTDGHLWAAEFLLTRVKKLLTHAIMPTPALAAHRDVLLEEITELLSEDRSHPAQGVVADDTWPPETPAVGEGEAPAAGTSY